MRFAVIPLVLSIAACAETGTGDETARMAEDEARQVAAARYPGVDIDGLADCVRANATATELEAMALGGVLASEATAEVLKRPQTAQCIEDNDIELPS